MSGECQVNVKSQSELDIGGRETCPSWQHFGSDILDVDLNPFGKANVRILLFPGLH